MKDVLDYLTGDGMFSVVQQLVTVQNKPDSTNDRTRKCASITTTAVLAQHPPNVNILTTTNVGGVESRGLCFGWQITSVCGCTMNTHTCRTQFPWASHRRCGGMEYIVSQALATARRRPYPTSAVRSTVVYDSIAATVTEFSHHTTVWSAALRKITMVDPCDIVRHWRFSNLLGTGTLIVFYSMFPY
jgi:hypothetical protein